MPISTILAVCAFCGAFLLMGWLSIVKLKMQPRGIRWFKYRTRKR